MKELVSVEMFSATSPEAAVEPAASDVSPPDGAAVVAASDGAVEPDASEVVVEAAASDVTSPDGAAVVAAPDGAVEPAASDVFPPDGSVEPAACDVTPPDGAAVVAAGQGDICQTPDSLVEFSNTHM